MTWLYLVRHGSTSWNEAGRLQGSEIDEPLSAKGALQAKGAQRMLEGVDVDVVVRSPMARARETAAICGFGHATVDRRWIESDLGEWSGAHVDGLLETRPDDYAAWRAGGFDPPGGEPLAATQQRVRSAASDLRSCRAALVFTHGGTIRAAVSALAGVDLGTLVAALPGSLAVLHLANGGRGSLLSWNLVADVRWLAAESSQGRMS